MHKFCKARPYLSSEREWIHYALTKYINHQFQKFIPILYAELSSSRTLQGISLSHVADSQARESV